MESNKLLNDGLLAGDEPPEKEKVEFLMSTRKRRSNAGNKMQKLLEQEVQEMGARTQRLDEDELDLLFQEDNDDEDFASESGVDEEEEEANKQQEVKDAEKDGNADEMISEPESSEEEEEAEDEGERELRRQEKLQRRKRRQHKIPVVVKQKNETSSSQSKKTHHHSEQPTAQSLLNSQRRTSSRSAVVANKLHIYEKLSKAEAKRKIIQERLKKQKEKQEREVLTQEDRMRIAQETEQINLLTLNKYKEQEIFQKQSRLAMQQRQKLKFRNGEQIIQGLTTAYLVTPLMEIEDKAYWDEQVRKKEKRRKKYQRRQPKKSDLDSKQEKTNLQTATAGNTEVKAEEKKHKAPLQEATNAEENNSQELKIQVQENINEDRLKAENHNKISNTPVSKDHQLNATCDGNGSLTIGKENSAAEHEQTMQSITSSSKANTEPLTKNSALPIATPASSTDAIDKASSTEKQVSFSDSVQVTTIESNFKAVTTDAPINDSQEDSDIKSHMDCVQNYPESDTTEEELVYEGPEQLVGRNFVTLYTFPDKNFNKDVSTTLFWWNKDNQNTEDYETIVKLSMPEETSNDLSLVPNFSFLDKFPKFGEYNKKIVTDADDDGDKKSVITIITEPPAGILLTKNTRKKCFITNKDCQYFDPRNGIPYSDVDAYRIIQELQDPIGKDGTDENPKPHFKWFGFREGGIYLDMYQRPAKGVPESF